MAAPIPTAEGTLEGKPLAHLLVYIDQKKLSGTLAIWPDPGETGEADRLFIRSGAVVRGRFRETFSAIERGALSLFSRTAAPYQFFEGLDLVQEDARALRGSVDLLGLVAASLRGGGREEIVASVLDRLGDQKIRLRAATESVIQRYGLTGPEAAFVEYVRASPESADGLTAGSGLPEKNARRLLYLLAITRVLEAHAPEEAAGASARPERTSDSARAARGSAPPNEMQKAPPKRGAPPKSMRPPSGLSDELLALWNDIADRLDAADEQNFFDLLQIPRTATGAQAKDAFNELVKRVHPDRLPPELAPLIPDASRLFQHFREAVEILSDDEQRSRYVRLVADGGGTPASDRKIADVLDAASALQRAQTLRKQRRYDAALAEVRDSIALNADDASAYAELATTLFQAHEGEGAPLAEILSACNQAISLHDDNVSARYTRGLVLRRMGKETDALKEFQRIVQIQPKHVEAQRELRFFDMRQSRAPRRSDNETQGTSGTSPWSKWFKKG